MAETNISNILNMSHRDDILLTNDIDPDCKCLTETWFQNGDDSNSNVYLWGYKSIHQAIKKDIGGEVIEIIIPGKTFKSFFKKTHSVMNEFVISLDELRTALNLLKTNKIRGIDEINAIVLKSVFDIIELPLLTIFNLSLKTGVFPDQLKIARVVPIYKNYDNSLASNYRPISILSCFSKLLERIMYNRL
ncbi:uncharacterized protein LOC136086793 [Hydra vulgaris]|uniref:Uncharacterized protein LOC136086793 n=1 Tax=Hydra vulgaris TaxID=6087 RepID=A0ABM4CTV6_HYDVU